MKIIQEKSFEKARKKIRESKEKVIFFSNDDELNRKILEKERISILLISLFGRKDYQKQRNSGFNQVLAKLAMKNKVIIGIDLDEMINADKVKKPEIFARIRQNIKLCNKNKLKMVFVLRKYFRSVYDFKALGSVLGMPTWMLVENGYEKIS